MPRKTIKRITVKIGTRVITDKSNRLNSHAMYGLTDQIADLMDKGVDVVVVSSGAISAGLGLLKLQKSGKSLSELQAIASVGQNHLMDMYNECFKKRGYIAGQVLLTQEDFNCRKRFLNIRYTLSTLLKYKAVPVINENDSVSTDEIKCGDNDRLSSLVAALADSDMLILLTDVDGLYDAKGNLLEHVGTVTRDIENLCKGKSCGESTGGMATKLEAVKNAACSGIPSVIASGARKNVVLDIASGKNIGTSFDAREKPLKARKQWIAFGLKPKGRIVVDAGAVQALTKHNRSLLPGGILDVSGSFAEGDVIEIITCDKKVVARGLANYSSDEIEKIKGKKSDRIEFVLGYKDYDEVVHRDNLVVL